MSGVDFMMYVQGVVRVGQSIQKSRCSVGRAVVIDMEPEGYTEARYRIDPLIDHALNGGFLVIGRHNYGKYYLFRRIHRL